MHLSTNFSESGKRCPQRTCIASGTLGMRLASGTLGMKHPFSGLSTSLVIDVLCYHYNDSPIYLEPLICNRLDLNHHLCYHKVLNTLPQPLEIRMININYSNSYECDLYVVKYIFLNDNFGIVVKVYKHPINLLNKPDKGTNSYMFV